MTILEIHYPDCGEFKEPQPVMRGKKGCPRCGHPQAIVLEALPERNTRFEWEKRGFSFRADPDDDSEVA